MLVCVCWSGYILFVGDVLLVVGVVGVYVNVFYVVGCLGYGVGM